jgi:hypothetical protein
MPIIVVAYICGFGTAAACAFSLRDWLAKKADEDLLEANQYINAEVQRLRAQVAMLIGTPKFPNA